MTDMWDGIDERIGLIYTRLVAQLKDEFPDVYASTWSGSGFLRYGRMAQFMFRDETDEEGVLIDCLILDLQCAPSKHFRDADNKPLFPEAEGLDVIGFSIHDGGGRELAELAPILLPRLSDEHAYEAAVLAYVENVERFLAEQFSFVSERLWALQLIAKED